MKRVLFLLSALAVCAGAVELYWDTGPESGGSVRGINLYAVRFDGYYDYGDDGPGDTGGREGTVYAFRVFYKEISEEDPVNLYLYSTELEFGYGYVPDEPLHDGVLEYAETQEDDWTVYTLIEPFEVPGNFFAVLEVPTTVKIHYTDKTRDYVHSYGYYYNRWNYTSDDYRIRVEWEPNDTAVVKTSWGEIKATK